MEDKALIDLTSYPVSNVLEQLLKDKTTKKNIIFATDTYSDYGDGFSAQSEMTKSKLLGFDSCDIQPRARKSLSDQQARTRKNAEVFTPSWICNKMNNHCDSEWFGIDGVFNSEDGQSWVVNRKKVRFPEGLTWQDYVESKRIEITCGEAPYVVSRYDTTSGEIIPINKRIGLLDRKLRVINENVNDEQTWLEWVIKAFQSVYGYEYQGDNLLIARINLINTFVDYLEKKWKRQATNEELRKIANIVVWNFWQMDGISNTIPFGVPEEENQQMSLFDFIVNFEEKTIEETPICRIYDWKANRSILYTDLKKGN